MADPANIVGYLGVVVPDRDFWQGYFINDAFAERAHEMLAEMRRNPELRNGSKIIAKLSIPDADQPILGNLCGVIASAALGETDYPDTVIGVCSYAIYELINRRFFWLDGRPEEGGIRTTIMPIYVSTLDEARDYINALPLVGKIKRRLLQRARFGSEPRDGREGQTRSTSIMHAAKRWPAIDKLVADIEAKLKP